MLDTVAAESTHITFAVVSRIHGDHGATSRTVAIQGAEYGWAKTTVHTFQRVVVAAYTKRYVTPPSL